MVLADGGRGQLYTLEVRNSGDLGILYIGISRGRMCSLARIIRVRLGILALRSI